MTSKTYVLEKFEFCSIPRHKIKNVLGHLRSLHPHQFLSFPAHLRMQVCPPEQQHIGQKPSFKIEFIFYCVECGKSVRIKGHLMFSTEQHQQLNQLKVVQRMQQLQKKRGNAEDTGSSSASPFDKIYDNRPVLSILSRWRKTQAVKISPEPSTSTATGKRFVLWKRARLFRYYHCRQSLCDSTYSFFYCEGSFCVKILQYVSFSLKPLS